MIFKQLLDKESCTFTYLIGDPVTKDAVLIDPVDTQLAIYLDLLKQYELTLKYSLETHVHADHITASGQLRQQLGAKTAVSALCGASSADIQIQDGDIFEFAAGESIKVIATPGHTAGSVSFLWRDRIFTGDALFIDGCGRTDFQGGDAGALYDAITQRIFTLADETLVYPGHDYKGRWVSSVIQERTTNSRLAGKSRAEFIDIMDNLNLPKPKLIDLAVPANRYCGVDEELANQAAEVTAGSEPKRKTADIQSLVDAAKQTITEITVTQAQEIINNSSVTLIDVREAAEFDAGHIENALLIPRGQLEFKVTTHPALSDKSSAIMLYCAGGHRSALAAKTLINMGYTNVLSIAGGYDAWQQKN